MQKFFLFFLVLIFALKSTGQNALDSLVAKLDTATEANQKIALTLNIAIQYAKKNEPKQQFNWLQKALQISKTSKLTNNSSSPYCDLATYYMLRGVMDTCLIYIKEGSIIAEKINNTHNLGLLKIIESQCYGQQEEFKKAIEIVKPVLQFPIKNFKDSNLIAQVYQHLGMQYKAIAQLDSSMYYFDKGVAFTGTEPRFDGFRNTTKFYKANAYNTYEVEPEKAKTLLLECLPYLKEKDPLNYFAALSDLAGTYRNLGDYTNAKKTILAAEPLLYLAEGDIGRQLVYYGRRYVIDSFTGDYKSALKHVRIYNDLNNTLINNDKQSQLDAFAFEQKENALKIQNAQRLAKINKQRNFILLILIIVSAFTALAYLWYRNKQKVLKQQQEREKVQTELRLLKAKLDPHFLHNFFSFLGNEVRKGSQTNAYKILMASGKYFRTILEQDNKDVVSLEDEIIHLTDYLDIQKTIHQNKFEYTVTLAEDVDDFGISIPSFLLQPFIENSIKHGFSSIAHKGKIDLDFTVDEDFLYCVIKDNGFGASTSKSISNSTSMGIKLTEDRLALFSKFKKNKGRLKRFPSDVGFTVVIDIPLV
jgi:tetratricopeptide (TPR) repeat protein